MSLNQVYQVFIFSGFSKTKSKKQTEKKKKSQAEMEPAQLPESEVAGTSQSGTALCFSDAEDNTSISSSSVTLESSLSSTVLSHGQEEGPDSTCEDQK